MLMRTARGEYLGTVASRVYASCGGFRVLARGCVSVVVPYRIDLGHRGPIFAAGRLAVWVNNL